MNEYQNSWSAPYTLASWFGLINPILGFISVSLAAAIGGIGFYLNWQELRNFLRDRKNLRK